MIELKNIDVIVLLAGKDSRVLIAWQLAYTLQDPSEFFFKILRSESPSSEFEELGEVDGTAETEYEYIDETVNLMSEHRKIYYKIEVIRSSDDEIVSTLVDTWFNDPDVIASEIIRRNDMLLEHRIGSPCYLFLERTSGAFCPVCWDEVTQKSTRSNCRTCGGTGKLGGYYDPVFTYIDFSAAREIKQITEFGEVTPGRETVWMSNYPFLKGRDIIWKLGTGTFWRVVNLQPVQRSGTRIQQVMQVEQINRSDVQQNLGDETLEDATVKAKIDILKARKTKREM